MKVKLTYIPCLLDESTWIKSESHNQTISAVLISLFQKYPEIRDDSPCITVRVNGKELHPFLWANHPLKDGDEILVIQEIGWTWISGIGAAIFGTIYGVSIGGTVYGLTAYGWLQAALIIASLAYTIYSYCTAPSAPKTGQGLNSSPTYGWDGATMQVRQGIPVPVVYGEHLEGGNLRCHIILG